MTSWVQLTVIVFVLNGACTFGHRMLADWKLDGYIGVYLASWYLAGALCLLPVAVAGRARPRAADWGVGLGLGLCSLCGQTCLALALGSGVPGSVAYPVALAGGMLLVILAGVFVFGERLGPAGWAGVAAGLAALALLSLP